MAGINEPPLIQGNRYCDPSTEINVLLLGPTGIGKSTFINGLANYICYDTLNEAVNDELQAVIPSSFSYNDDAGIDRTIRIGDANEHESFNDDGHSCTQLCRSFVFPVGKRNLRIIDAPGIGDTRGLDQDAKNFHEILTYISQYEHLNAVCILLRPNEERLNILFRFCVNELLRHLHKSASENIIFVFTNARSTFFKPGGTSKLLRKLLEEHLTERDVSVPFSATNTFLLDNEPFRYLALRQSGFQLDQEQTSSYEKSWDHTVKEYAKLMNYIVTRPLHAVSNTVSLNEAEQLIRKLARPIAETAKLIEQNIQLAQQHKDDVLKNPQMIEQGLPQNNVQIKHLKYPRTVCVNEKCCRSIIVNNEKKIEYISQCHEHCYLKGVVQETIRDQRIRDCEIMEFKTGKCMKCGCSWKEHQHITYEYQTNLTRLGGRLSLDDIDQRISDLRREKSQIEDVYKQLAKFLHANAILPIHDDIIEYLKHFIREEQMKKNQDVVRGLEKMLENYLEEIDLFKKTIENLKDPSNERDVLKPDQIFPLVGTLYRLPINGQKIREQVDGIKITQGDISASREVFIQLPEKASRSKVMSQFRDAFKTK
ncbi:hypothetical protein I4U23_023176 [Adineta vaga]|nr:hypothetical protein I4U23_023176 [Adineta vaga]